jgi:hypothetical protein
VSLSIETIKALIERATGLPVAPLSGAGVSLGGAVLILPIPCRGRSPRSVVCADLAPTPPELDSWLGVEIRTRYEALALAKAYLASEGNAE